MKYSNLGGHTQYPLYKVPSDGLRAQHIHRKSLKNPEIHG
jgi:hypothetical protein